MESYKKVVYITKRKTRLSRKRNILVIKENGKTYQIPFINIESIIVFSPSEIPLNLLKYCYRNEIRLVVFSQTNKIDFLIDSNQNSFRIIEQIKKLTNPEKALAYSKDNLKRKLTSQKKVLDDLRRNNRNVIYEPIDLVRKELKEAVKRIDENNSIESLRGLEGSSGRKYYQCFDDMILKQREDFEFKKRTKMPPEDEVNVLLSLFYTVLTNFVSEVLISLGFNAKVGFYHNFRKTRNSLACDCVEPLRVIVDKFVLFLINTKKINIDYFEKKDDAIIIKEEFLGKLFYFWESYLNEEIYFREFDRKLSRKNYIFRTINDQLESYLEV